MHAEKAERNRASKVALENLLESEQLAYKNQQLIIEELANSNEPAHVIVDKRRAGVSTTERETLTADLLAQVPSLRRLKQTGTTSTPPILEDDVWITAPLDTVDPLPYAPTLEYVGPCPTHCTQYTVFTTCFLRRFVVDERMAAGGLTITALVMQALTAALSLTRIDER